MTPSRAHDTTTSDIRDDDYSSTRFDNTQEDTKSSTKYFYFYADSMIAPHLRHDTPVTATSNMWFVFIVSLPPSFQRPLLPNQPVLPKSLLF